MRGAGGAKLEEMRAEIDGRLANPLLYSRGDGKEVETLQKKRAEVEDGLARRGAVARGARAARSGGGRVMPSSALVPTFVTLFVVIDPIAVAPLFVALTQGMDEAERRLVACGRS